MKNIYKILCLWFIGASSCAMEKRKEPELSQESALLDREKRARVEERSAFELLPDEIKDMILKQLVTTSGQTNAIKLHLAANNIHTFMTTNSLFAPFLEDERIQGYLIRELARRYANGSLIEAAVALHTAAGGRWLRPRIIMPELRQEMRHAVSILRSAAETGDVAVVSFLINYLPADVINHGFLMGDTALISASQFRQLAVIERLLAMPEIDINIQNDRGVTALIAALDAVEYGPVNIPVVQRLLAVEDNDYNLPDNDRITPLMHAVLSGNNEAVGLLLAKPGIELNAQNNVGNTALFIALSKRFTDIARRLLAMPEINVNLANEDQETALGLVQDPQYPARDEIIALLRARGAQ